MFCVRDMRRYLIMPVLALVSLLLFSGCGEMAGGGAAEPEPPKVTVGSTFHAESWLMGRMAKILLEEHLDAEVEQAELQGAMVMHEAMESDDIQIYLGYTGTQFTGILGKTVTEEWRDRDRVYDYVKEEFEQRYDQTWLSPFGFDNTYALAVPREYAEEHALETISDLREHAPDMILGSDPNWREYPEVGYDAFVDYYDMDFQEAVTMDYGLLYRSLRSGDIDAAVAYATDARIVAMDLVTLEDDLGFFPPYDGAYVVRKDLLEEYPEVRETLELLAGKLDDAQMSALNAEVDVHERDYPEVAREFLEEQGLID